MQFEVRLTTKFKAWLDDIKDQRAVQAISKRLARIEIGGFGDHKSIGNGISELRIDHGPGYRAYYTIRGQVIVIMLAGGTKRTQERDIRRAQQMAKEI